MLHKITFTVLKIAVLLAATAAAVGLTVTGHIIALEGLLLTLGAILAATIFGFRLADGIGPDRLSIWAGPSWPSRPAPSPPAARSEVRKAA